MATDKLMNHTQGESIITNLSSIASNLQNVTAISPAKFGMGYAVCDTAAATAAKTATLANYTLTEGALVTVKFTNGSTSTGATLNLNDTGAKNILYKGQALTSNIISAGDICTFIYSTNAYNIINLDALSGAGAGTVRSIGAEGGLITDQTEGAAIQQEGSVKLNLKSDDEIVDVGEPDTTTNKTYPVALDSNGYPGVAVPWTDTTYSTFTDSVDGLVPAADGTGESAMFLKGDGTWATPTNTTYSQGSGINIDANNEISNTGVTAIAPSATNGNISVTTNGSTADVAVTGLDNAAYKDVDTTIDMSNPSAKLPTSAAVSTAITNAVNALPEPMVFKGTVSGTYPLSPAVGDTYKATADSNNGVTPQYKSGDTVIYSEPSTGTFEWVVIPSGDEPDGTVTGVTGSDGVVTTDTELGGSTISKAGTVKLALVTNHTTSVNAGNATSTANRSYPVAIDGNSKLAVNVPWENTTYAFADSYDATNNKGATVATVTNAINALDVTEVSVGSTKTINKISQTDGKISVTTTDIQSASTSQKGLVQLNDTLVSTSTALAATANAVKAVNDKAETNQTNILYIKEHNANRNLLLNTASTTTIDGVTFTVNADKSVTITGSQNNPSQHTKFILGKFTANRSDLVLDSGIAASASANIFINTQDGVTTTRNLGHATITGTDLNTERDYQILVIAGTSNINTTIKPMICTQADWNATQEYEASGGLSNYDLTYLESQDRVALAEVVDSGAKNLAPEATKTITTTGWSVFIQPTSNLPAGNYTVDFNCSVENSAQLQIRYSDSTNQTIDGFITSSQTHFTATFTATKPIANIGIYTNSGTSSFTNIMLATKAAFGISPAFVKYCKPLASKVDHTIALGSVDLNDVITDGRYMCSPTANSPVSGVSFLQVYNDTSYDLKQVLQKLNEPSIVYIRHRRYNSGTPPYTWTAWYKFTGTVVS